MKDMALRSRTWSSGELILLVAAFVALFCNVGFFTSATNAVGTSGTKLLFIASLFFQIASIFVLVLSAVCHRALVKPALIFFLLLSSVLTYFTTKYGTIFDFQMIANVVETDTAEAGDLLSVQLLLYVLLLGILPSVAIWHAKVDRPHWKQETLARLKLVAAAACVFIAAFVPFSAHNASLLREHRDVTEKIVPTYALYSVVKFASRSLKPTSHERTIVGADARIPPTDVHRELVVMVVGETVRADHWGLNGYARDTTPLLRREGVVNFPDFWSCDTSTAKSVPCMFSNLGRAHFDRDKVVGRDNALDILARSGVSVLWRDNNSSSKGVADRVTYQDFKTTELNPVCEGGECRDMGMLRDLQQFIDAQKGDILIVLHQMGNHGPAYYKRYPKEFERFTPVCKTNDLGSCTEEEIINTYDNAILYTDYFLSQVIALLKRNDSAFETALFYVSDHGESLGEYGMYLHAAPYAIAPDTQKHVPAVMWFGENIKHDLKLDSIAERSRRRWSHDNVFATLLGLFEIQSEAYPPQLDILEHAEEQTSALH
jgi:lipid A ethanolaminephosphotransferase